MSLKQNYMKCLLLADAQLWYYGHHLIVQSPKAAYEKVNYKTYKSLNINAMMVAESIFLSFSLLIAREQV